MSKLSDLQLQYDQMCRILDSLNGEPTGAFMAEFIQLAKIIKGLGGRV